MDHNTNEPIAEPSCKLGNSFNSDISTAMSNERVPLRIVWKNVMLLLSLHIACLYGVYLIFTSAKWETSVFAAILYVVTCLGITAGAHRLWSHRSYKAKLGLRILLAFMFTLAFETDIFEWCRDHRLHHKYSETDADPYNAKRGFFFAHIGWIMCRKHPDVIKKGKSIDMSDLLADPVVRFQRKYYLRLGLVICFILPTIIPVYFWNESFLNSLMVPALMRFCLTSNATWLVNSAAHLYGSRPYDVNIYPRENGFVCITSVGEGFHNYHHTFPYDYAASEYGMKYNLTTAFIDLMAFLGLAYDLKTASQATVKSRKLRTGGDSLKSQESVSPKND